MDRTKIPNMTNKPPRNTCPGITSLNMRKAKRNTNRVYDVPATAYNPDPSRLRLASKNRSPTATPKKPLSTKRQYS